MLSSFDLALLALINVATTHAVSFLSAQQLSEFLTLIATFIHSHPEEDTSPAAATDPSLRRIGAALNRFPLPHPSSPGVSIPPVEFVLDTVCPVTVLKLNLMFQLAALQTPDDLLVFIKGI